MTTSSARARAWACTGGSGADDFVYDEAAERDDEDDKAASGASSAHGSSDSEEESGGEGEAHHVRQRLRHRRLVGTLCGAASTRDCLQMLHIYGALVSMWNLAVLPQDTNAACLQTMGTN